METSSAYLPKVGQVKSQLKHLVSRNLSRFEPANSGYERRIQALEGQLHNLQGMQQDARIEDKIYKSFELNFRGSSELITQRLQERYAPLLEAQVIMNKHSILLDLGCGHGELLDLGKQAGLKTIGVDQSHEAVATCKERGHQTISGDLLSSLQGFSDSSIQMISFLHVIEHCEPGYTIKVFKEARRCLVEGGAFLVETPSIFSLWASARQFYLDPSHLRPIHPEYIQFVGRNCGFTQCEVREYGKVKHPEACDFDKIISALNNDDAACEIRKLDKWLYGPMDLACIFKK